jgi:hypothetical protein
MKIHIEINEKELKDLVYQRISEILEGGAVAKSQIRIEVKSKQNYNSEWESADFRAVIEVIK